MRRPRWRAALAAAALAGLLGCSSESKSQDGGGGAAGSVSTGGSGTGGAGTGGAGTGGAPAKPDGSATSDGPAPDAQGTPGGPMGTQPLGSLCANTGNCSQSSGMAVCCVNTCTLAEACPSGPNYLPCMKAADCDQFGGGKVCCQTGSTRFCTKPSACSGMVLP